MMMDVLTIPMSKRDILVYQFKTKVDQLEDRGRLSFLIKFALLHYIKTGTFVTIGKIRYNPHEQYVSNQKIALYIKDTPEIGTWVQRLKQENNRSNRVIIEIVSKSISVVDDPSEEWIMSYYEAETLKYGITLTNQPIIAVEKNVKSIEKPTNIVDNQIEKEEINVKKNHTGEIEKNAPRAFSLTGKRFTN